MTAFAQGSLFDLDSPLGDDYRNAANVVDIDGDGVDDVLVGAPESTSSQHSGRIHLHSGVDGSVLRSTDGTPAWTTSPDGHAGFGQSVCGVDDIDGDGLGDYAVGCVGHHDSGQLVGAVHVYSGADGSEMFTTLGAGTTVSDQFGFRMFPAGDFDLDGTNDLLVQSGLALTISIVSGANGSILHEISTNLLASPLSDLDQDGVPDYALRITTEVVPSVEIRSGQDGTLIYEFDGPVNSEFGKAVGPIGDQDGDGQTDFFIGQPNTFLTGGIGKLRIYSGSTGQVRTTYVSDLPNTDFGASAVAAGDVNGDGLEDIAIGAPGFNPGGMPQAGRVQVFASGSGALLATHVGPTAGGHYGIWIFALGDLNHDGAADIGVRAKTAGGLWNVQVHSSFDHLGGQYCGGDEQTCPCANDGDSGGCQNSTGGGARVFGHGSFSVGSDDFMLEALQLPAGTAVLLFAGDSAVNGRAGSTFGDGLLCVGGSLERLGLHVADATGGASWGPGLAGSAGWIPGDQRFLQVWYRNPAGPCGSGFNTSNAMAVTLVP